MEFEWDEAKSRRNQQERGIGFAFAAAIFLGPTIGKVDDRFDYGEVRIKAIGMAGGVVLTVVYTDRNGRRRIISARMAARRERELWHSVA